MAKFWMRGRFFTCSFFIGGKENVLLNVLLTLPSAINVRVGNGPTSTDPNPKGDLKQNQARKLSYV